MKLYINTSERNFFDKNGASLADETPQIPYKSRQEIILQLCTATPDADSPGVNPETDWPQDTSFNIPGVSAILSVDSDFKRRNKGGLPEDVQAGELSTITGTFSGVTSASFRIPGTLRLFDAAGHAEYLPYTDLTVSGSNVTFILAENSSIAKSYSKGDVVDAPDSLYMQSALNAEKSNPATGLFVFDLVADSVKLRNAVEYSNTNVLSSIAGMELLIFTSDKDNIIEERNSFICRTVSVTGTIGDPDSTVSVPDLTKNALTAAVSSLLAQGMETEYSIDKSSWHTTQAADDKFLRFRFVQSSGVDSAWVYYEIKKGDPGLTPYIRNGNWYIGDTNTGVKAEGVNGTSAGFGTPVLNVTTGEPGTEASGTVTASGADTAKVFTINLTIPEGMPGEKGEKGDPMKIDATGTTAELSQYDAEPKGFSFLATDTGMVYIKSSDDPGDWSEPVGFQGPPGYTPVRGTDYWTENDIAEIKSYVDEVIINGAW